MLVYISGTLPRVPNFSLAEVRTSANDPETYGLLGIYDVMDPAAVWGNRSRFWQDIGYIYEMSKKCNIYTYC